MIGSMNPISCVFINLLWLWLVEYNLRLNATAITSPYTFTFSDDITVPGGRHEAKETAPNILGQKALRMKEFQSGGLLGSHSICKFASTNVC
jgi:hypothetical protein